MPIPLSRITMCHESFSYRTDEVAVIHSQLFKLFFSPTQYFGAPVINDLVEPIERVFFPHKIPEVQCIRHENTVYDVPFDRIGSEIETDSHPPYEPAFKNSNFSGLFHMYEPRKYYIGNVSKCHQCYSMQNPVSSDQ
mmetsp:Transcript_939/g.1903  ORF Transcript_939/g.1903 Transcript_939/m.1903 type:complete len:137 (+) Transcript_939:215-625(+)